MHGIRSAFILSIVIASGCGGTDLLSPAMLIGRESDETISSGGVDRRYRVFLPSSAASGAAAPQPLVLALHGLGMDPTTMSWVTNMSSVAEKHGFIVVYPGALDGNWNDGVLGSEVDDVAFIRELLDKLQASYRIDPKRIYIAGLSKGGYMANRLAIELSDRIAAVAPVSAVMSTGLAGVASSGRPIPVMIIEGEADPIKSSVAGIVGQFGGIGSAILSALETVNFWIGRNHAAANPGVTYEPDGDPEDGTRVRRETHPAGPNGAEVVLLSVEGGGHAWPGDGGQFIPEAIFGKTSRDISASETIWEFFSHHSLP